MKQEPPLTTRTNPPFKPKFQQNMIGKLLYII